jgi:hypothetical protein
MVEESLTLFRAREVLKWRTGVEEDSVFCSVAVGRFDCSTAVLKARELVISSAERREMSWGLLVVLSVIWNYVWMMLTSCLLPLKSSFLFLHSLRRLAMS